MHTVRTKRHTFRDMAIIITVALTAMYVTLRIMVPVLFEPTHTCADYSGEERRDCLYSTYH